MPNTRLLTASDTTQIRHHVLDVPAATQLEEFGRIWLLDGHAHCRTDGSPLEPLHTIHDLSLYICLSGNHSWHAPHVDDIAWSSLLTAHDPDGTAQLATLTTPSDRRRLVHALNSHWSITPLRLPGLPPEVRYLSASHHLTGGER